jgi:hypothetical protein
VYLGASAIYCTLYALSPIIVPISINFLKPDECSSYVPIILYAELPARIDEFVINSSLKA